MKVPNSGMLKMTLNELDMVFKPTLFHKKVDFCTP